MASEHTPTVLSIAGYDPYGGAGVMMDTKTIHALGGYALTAITALTAQNAHGVVGVEAVTPQTLRLQLETLLDNLRVDAVKIGMLANRAILETVVDVLRRYTPPNIVLDPVLVSSSGTPLLEADAIGTMVEKLFPLCTLITPNLDETNTLLGTAYTGVDDDVPHMAEGLRALGAPRLLLKGGHTASPQATDTLITPTEIIPITTPRLHTDHTHGTGCLLSSAIATHLAHGTPLELSVRRAKKFLHQKLIDAEGLRLSYRGEGVRKEPIF